MKFLKHPIAIVTLILLSVISLAILYPPSILQLLSFPYAIWVFGGCSFIIFLLSGLFTKYKETPFSGKKYKYIQHFIYDFLQHDYFHYFIIIIILLNTIIIIVQLLPYHKPLLFCDLKMQVKIFTQFDLFSGAIFLLEYIGRVWTCVLDRRYSRLNSHIKARLMYIKEPMAIIDALAILPSGITLGRQLNLLQVNSAGLLRMLRLVRLARLGKMARHKSLKKIIYKHYIWLITVGSIIFIFLSAYISYLDNQKITIHHIVSTKNLLERITPDNENSFSTTFYNILYSFLGEMLDTPQSPTGKIYSLLVFLLGILASGIIFAKFTSYLIALNIHKKTPNILVDHIVICHWNERTDAIVKKLHDDVVQSKKDIVIITSQDIDERELRINEEYEDVYFLKGDSTDLSVLKRASVLSANSVIILSDTNKNSSNNKNFDSQNILIALGIKALKPKELSTSEQPWVIAEAKNAEMGERFKLAGVHEIVDFIEISGVLAQSVFYPKISSVFFQLLKVSKDTNEIYISNQISTSLTFNELADRLIHYRKNSQNPAIPIGVISQQNLILNPISSYNIKENDRIVVLAYEEPEKMIWKNCRHCVHSKCKKCKIEFVDSNETIQITQEQQCDSNTKPENYTITTLNKHSLKIKKDIYLLNYTENAIKTLKELYLAAEMHSHKIDVSIALVTDEKIDNIKNKLSHVLGKITLLDTIKIETISELPLSHDIKKITQNTVFILLKHPTSETPDADNALIALQIKKLTENKKVHPRIIAELNRYRNRPLLATSGVDETMSSADFASGITSVCALTHGVSEIFNRLLRYSDDTNEIYYIDYPSNKTLTFTQALENINAVKISKDDEKKNAILIGVLKKNGAIHLNPRDEDKVIIKENDKLIMIAYDSEKANNIVINAFKN